MDIFSELKRLALPLGQYVVVGGGCLAAHGLRETRDLDVVVLPQLFERLRQEGWEEDAVYAQKWNRKRLKRGEVEVYPDMILAKEGRFIDVAELVASADMIQGSAFLPLLRLLPFKEDCDREKDLADVALLRKQLGL